MVGADITEVRDNKPHHGRDGTFIHVSNGQLMTVYGDDNPDSSNNQPALVGIEIEGTPRRVSARSIWIKKLN